MQLLLIKINNQILLQFEIGIEPDKNFTRNISNK